MPTLRFSQVYDKLVGWLGTDSSARLRKPCVMLVQIDITGEFIPMCDPYPSCSTLSLQRQRGSQGVLIQMT